MKPTASLRISIGCLALGASLAVAETASAQLTGAPTAGIDDLGVYGNTHNRGATESPQHAALELRIGRYTPKIDNEFATATPYKSMFGTDSRYAVGVEMDLQVLRIPYLGTLGVGGALQYTKMSAPAFVASNYSRGGEDTTLTIFPLYAVAVLRADYIARSTPVPLVPYAKLGIGAGLWRVTNGGGTSDVGGVKGNGLSIGPQFALGGMLLLDAFDPDAASSLDDQLGINNSYVFVEWYDSFLNDFGTGRQMQVGTNSWVLGLAFEM